MEQESDNGKREAPRQPSGQRFMFGAFVFNVDRALETIAEHPREPQLAEVAPWASFFGFDITGEHSIALFGPRNLDHVYAMTTDLKDPVIVATLTSSEGERFPLVIDGTHRIYRAYMEGVPTLPALVLDAAESMSIRDDPFVRSSVHWQGDHSARQPEPPTEGGQADG
jgi:hypothetical protein